MRYSLVRLVVVVVAVGLAATLTAWGLGGFSDNRPSRIEVVGVHPPRGAASLVKWCSTRPGDSQAALLGSLGAPLEHGAPGRGHELWLNVTPRPLLSLDVAIVPIHKRDGYDVWKRGGYLMADTYSPTGKIIDLDAWAVDVDSPKLGCGSRRGRPFGPVGVPKVVGQTISQAEATLEAADLLTSMSPISSIWFSSLAIQRQSPAAHTEVVAGLAVRVDLYRGGILRFTDGGPTLRTAVGDATPTFTGKNAISLYLRRDPEPQGASTTELLGFATWRGDPQLTNRLAWLVASTHLPLSRSGGPIVKQTWIGVIDAHTGRYLATLIYPPIGPH